MLSEEQKQQIQSAYSRFLDSRGLKARYGQKLMIAAVARTVGNIALDAEGRRCGNAQVCAIEAGTGTGKTVAYALASIPLAQARDKHVIIATATVALQEQIVQKDLPDLRKHAQMVFSHALAKGRGRYACVYKLDYQLVHGSGAASPSASLYPEEPIALLSPATLGLYQQMLEALGDNSWDGDRDSWPQAIAEEDWQRLTTDHSQCTGRRCAYVTQCPFFRAREQLVGADVIVANHDLVLADLALGGGAILPAPEDSLYIFDEGHHLPDKALQHFAEFTRLQGSMRWLQGVAKSLAAVAQLLPSARAVQVQMAQWANVEPPLLLALQQMLPMLEQLFVEPGDSSGAAVRMATQYRFAGGSVPEAIREQAAVLVRGWQAAGDVLRAVSAALEELLDGRDIAREIVEQAYAAAGGLWQRCRHAEALWRLYAADDVAGQPPTARWLTLHESSGGFDLEASASPVLPVNVLDEHLWQRCYSAVLTSATLTALGSFDRLRQRAGLPADSACTVVPSPFRHGDVAELHVPPSAVEADNRNTVQHTQSVVDFINALDLQEAALVLFASRRQMLDVYQQLSATIRAAVLLQDDYSKQQLLQLHRERVDRREPSVIFGLASLAEGVDLPGDYLRHVVIAKIPFAPPDDPIEQTLAEWLEARGENAFMQVTVADASVKLVQAAGRLLRTESDTGRITILDKRMVSKRYGRALLDSLPPFRRVLN